MALLGIDAYGSDSDSDNGENTPQSSQPAPSLPNTASSSSLNLPPPKKSGGRRRDGPVRITVDLPKPSNASGNDDGTSERGSKRPRLDDSVPPPPKTLKTAGAGSSSLLSMLPAPKTSNLNLPKPKSTPRVLGGGLARSDDAGILMPSDETEQDTATLLQSEDLALSIAPMPSVTSFVPMSATRPKTKPPATNKPPPVPSPAVPKAAPSINFFSFDTPSSTMTPSTSKLPSISPSVSISSAPKVEDYIPPPPTPTDPYPGYYQKPNQEWAAYDPAYYATFYKQWEDEYNAALGLATDKGKRKQRGWVEGQDEDADLVNVNAQEEMQKSQVAAREAKKKLTEGASGPAAQPRMNIKAAGTGRARQRGQLASLLLEAHANREAIEEQIAAGRRNQKEAGNKYGF